MFVLFAGARSHSSLWLVGSIVGLVEVASTISLSFSGCRPPFFERHGLFVQAPRVAPARGRSAKTSKMSKSSDKAWTQDFLPPKRCRRWMPRAFQTRGGRVTLHAVSPTPHVHTPTYTHVWALLERVNLARIRRLGTKVPTGASYSHAKGLGPSAPVRLSSFRLCHPPHPSLQLYSAGVHCTMVGYQRPLFDHLRFGRDTEEIWGERARGGYMEQARARGVEPVIFNLISALATTG